MACRRRRTGWPHQRCVPGCGLALHKWDVKVTEREISTIVEKLMADAVTAAGLTDFGAPSFREGLGRFVAALAEASDLPAPVIAQAYATATRRLINRLEIEDHYRAHPELSAQEVADVVSITGLPRTGTTALANIMSMDDHFRSLRTWEQAKSCPPPTLEDEEHDPRRLAALAIRDRMVEERPDLAAMHLFDVDTTEEDVEVLGLDFHAQQLALPLYGYHAWWREADMTETFAYHLRVIKLLQSRRPPNRWLFKAPAHNFHLEAIVAAYPNARFIITHRDPAKAVPSACSFIGALTPPMQKEGEMERFGRHHAEHLRIGVERAVAARARIGEERFFDVHHRDFVRDPFGTLERIYAFLGQEFRPEARAKMEKWHAENSSGAHGSHRYTPEQFGLSTSQLRSDFDFYIQRFNIPLE